MFATDRVKGLLLQPRSEWRAIESHQITIVDLYRKYAVPLAAVGPIASFVGFSVVGVSMPVMGQYRTPIGTGLMSALIAFLMSLGGVFVIALIINALAPAFSGRKNAMQALKLAVYASTPAWLGGIFQLLPAAAALTIFAGLYALYLLYLGLPVLMKTPPEKALGYTAVITVCTILLYAAIGAVSASVGAMTTSSGIVTPALTAAGAATAPGQPDAAVEAAARRMEQAQRSGDIAAQVAASSEMMNALIGGTQFDPVDHAQLKAMIPETLNGFTRIRIESGTDTTEGSKVARAGAAFGDEGRYRQITLSITDTAGSRGLAMLAAWAAMEQESETGTGYEKIVKVGDRVVHEEYDRDARQGSYRILIARRFVVEARGYGIEMDALRQAVARTGPDRLEALKHHGATH
ncbi:MAG: Yip1 family protein [Burkholderiaceae bacterium]